MAAEQSRRAAVRELEALSREVLRGDRRFAADGTGQTAGFAAAENREVRIHRDEIDAEREHLSARLLH